MSYERAIQHLRFAVLAGVLSAPLNYFLTGVVFTNNLL